jgi:hypothetical protein
MHKLTLGWMDGSARPIVDGSERIFEFSGELLWKGTADCAPIRAPPDARLHHNDAEDEALLLVYSINLEVVTIASAKMNSSEDHRW